jgi:hypothetical protein
MQASPRLSARVRSSQDMVPDIISPEQVAVDAVATP